MRLHLEALIRLAYPAFCGVCRTLLGLWENGVCRNCCSQLEAARFPPHQMLLPTAPRGIDRAWSLYDYRSPVREMLTGVKFLKRRWLLVPFAEAIQIWAEVYGKELSYDLLLPVPLDAARLLQREFNQAEILAKMVRRITHLPLHSGILQKKQRTQAQASLARHERQVNLRHAFNVRSPRAVAGKSILLIDDILTTGATAEEAAQTLKQAGARKVGLFVLARTELKL